MGNLCFAKVDVLNVMDDPKHPNYGIGFSPNIFKPKEWKLLKDFANKKGIFQSDLNHLFDKYLSHDEVYLRQFRVRTLDTKKKFSDMGLLNFEISDVFLPQVFLRPYHGLEKPQEFDEATFPRFVVIGYTFCAQPITDLVFEYFSILRQNFNLQLGATIFSFNLLETLNVMCEELEKTAALKYILKKVNIHGNDTEYSLETVIRMGFKYPLMFYPLQRFRLHYRRLIFGDKFWENKKTTKTRFPSAFKELKGKTPGYESEEAAVRQTSLSIIADTMAQIEKEKSDVADFMAIHSVQDMDETDLATLSLIGVGSPEPESLSTETDAARAAALEKANKEAEKEKETFLKNVVKPLSMTATINPFPEKVSAEVCTRLKHDVGYSIARDVIQASGLPWDETQHFVNVPDENDTDVRIFDNKVNVDFVYNVGRGTTSWVTSFVDGDDDTVRETFTKITPPVFREVATVAKKKK